MTLKVIHGRVGLAQSVPEQLNAPNVRTLPAEQARTAALGHQAVSEAVVYQSRASNRPAASSGGPFSEDKADKVAKEIADKIRRGEPADVHHGLGLGTVEVSAPPRYV
jgi:hypothetical protein